MWPASLRSVVPPIWPVGACEFPNVQTTCTCTARAQCTPAPFFIRRQVGLAKVHPCTEFGVASSKFTFTGGPHVKTGSSPLARAAGTPLERHPQWILSWCSTRVTCEFGFSDSPRLTCRAVQFFFTSLHAAARATSADPRPAPMSFRRFGASIGATPVPIGPAVRAPCPEMLEHTHRLTNTIRPTFFSDPPEQIFVHKNVLCLSIGTFYSLRFWMTFDLWPDLQGHGQLNLRYVPFQRLKLANFGIFAGDMDMDRCCEVTPMVYTDIVTIPRSTEVIRGQWRLMTS